jgi:hypothetical protein
MIEVLLIQNVFAGARGAELLRVDRRQALVVDLLPPGWIDHKENIIPVRGVKRLAWDDEILAGDRIGFLLAPRGVEFTLAGFVKYLAIMFAANVIMRALLPKPPKPRKDDSSATYGYSGIEPSRVEGEPIPLYYGKMRVGGQVINEFIDDFGSGGAQYSVLLSLGEGALEEIAGQTSDTAVPITSNSSSSVLPAGKLYVNDSDASSLQGVTVQVRMGTLEQSSIEGFEFASSVVAIDTELVGPGDSIFEQVLNYSSPQFLANGVTSSNATWTDFGITYTMTVEGEEAVIKVLYPEGLTLSTGGNLVATNSGIAVRYIELNALGVPITTGGPEGDGYVRLRPTRFVSKLNPGSTVDTRVPLYDPQTFTRPALAPSLLFDFTSTPTTAPSAAFLSRTGTLTVPANGPLWTSSGAAESFTVEMFCYVQTKSVVFTGVSTFVYRVVRSTTVPAGAWFKLGQIRVGALRPTFTLAPGQSVQRTVPYVQLNSTTSSQFYEGKGETFFTPSFVFANTIADQNADDDESFTPAAAYAPGGWKHIVATFETSAVGTLNRVRLYANGVKLVDTTTSQTVTLPNFSSIGAGNFEIRGPGTDGMMQNVVIYKGVMDEDTIRRQYNNGNGRTNFISDLVPVFYMSGASTTVDGSGNGNTMTVNGPNLVSDSTYSIIEGTTPPTQRVKKSKYKIEVLRSIENSSSVNAADTMRWQSLSLREYDPFTYPTAPLVGVNVRASSEISGNTPNVTVVVKGRKVPVWDKISTDFPTFTVEFSRCPAWIVVDMLLDKNWGLGNTFDNTDLDIATFQEWADYCDGLVYNQSGYTATYSATTSGSAMTWSDVLHTTDSSGRVFEFYVPKDSIPSTVKIGDYIWVTGTPSLPSGVAFNSDDAGVAGNYEIVDIQRPAVAPHKIIVRNPSNSNTPWAVGALMSSVVTPAGTIQTRHPRFQYDGAIDQQGAAWDALLQVCASGRATIIRDGRKVRIAVFKPKSVSEIVGMAQIEAGSFEVEYLNPKTRFNQIEIGFLDEALFYERSMVSVEHPTIAGTTDSGLIRRRNFFQEGVIRRAQVLRQARYLLNQENEVRRKGRFVGSIDLVGLQPLDVIRIAHDVLDRGVSGRVKQDSSLSTQVYLDRTVVLAAATTYKLTVRSANAGVSNPPTLTVTSAAGTYAIGSPITVSTGYGIAPLKDDVWILHTDGEDLLAQVDSITLTPELQREIQWSEYVESVYDVEDVGDTPDIDVEFLTADTPASGRQSIPPIVDNVRAKEVVARGPGGSHQPRLLVSWEYGDNSSDTLAGFDVYVAPDIGLLEPFFELKATALPSDRSAVVTLENAAVGDSFLVAVVSRSQGGQARLPSRSGQSSVRMIGRSPAPTAPDWDSSFPYSLDGELATYRVEPGSVDESTTLEIRRGGWLLGQRVGAMPQDSGKFGPTANWTSAVATSVSAGEHLHGIGQAGQLFVRAVSERNKWSAADVVAWNPAPVDSEAIVDSSNSTYFTRSWEDYGIGWRRSGPVTPNATLTNCQVTTSILFPQGYLEFSGSNLTATYTTSDPLVLVDQRAEWFYNSAFFVGEQIWPTTWDDSAHVWDNGEAQWSWEGPLNKLAAADDLGRVDVKIEFRTFDEDDTYSDWQAYTPGKVRCQHVQWRLTMTRPSTAHQVRIYRFSTQLLRIPRQRFERSGLQFFVEHQIFGRT